MRTARLVFLIVFLADLAFSAEPRPKTICVAPADEKPIPASAPGLFCDSEKLSLRIDTQQTMPWPIKGSVKIAVLDATARHRVTVFCDGKPQQSFTFRFSEFKTDELCLFLNGLYKTVQLWEAKACPWCRCKYNWPPLFRPAL